MHETIRTVAVLPPMCQDWVGGQGSDGQDVEEQTATLSMLFTLINIC